MFSRTNIEEKLYQYRSKRMGGDSLIDEVLHVFSENEKQRASIVSTLHSQLDERENNFNFDLLEPKNIFHIKDIQKLCVDYRLRFLDSIYFKGNFPEEAISEIRQLEKKHHITIKNFKIVAPAKRLKLENADDPLLFAPMGNNYFYLLHKWGNDLHPLRKIAMWPYKNFENLVFAIIAISVLLTAIIPMDWFSKTSSMQETILLFLFILKGVAGIVLYYGFAKGKNFNEAIWKSNYYNG